MLKKLTAPIRPRTRDAVVWIAESQVGVVESPRGSNRQKYGQLYGMNGVAWCMEFVWCVFYWAGFPLKKTASCTQLTSSYKAAGQWVTSGYKVGDIVMFDFSGRRRITQHVGIVVETGPGYVITVEGNTSTRNDDNGGMVMRRKRSLNLITGACRPGYNM